MDAPEISTSAVKKILQSAISNINSHKVFINKLNQFHKHNLSDIIEIYAPDHVANGSADLANLKIILFDESQIKLNYLRGIKDDVDVVIDTPYDFITSESVERIKTVKDYFEELSIASALKMNRSHKQVKSITYPTQSVPSLMLFLLIQLPLILLFALKTSSAVGEQLSLLLGVRVETMEMVAFIMAVLTFLIHIIEIFGLKIFQLWSFHRVPTDVKVEHFVFAMLEGFPHHKRFNALVKKVSDSGFYDLDVEEADNII